MEATFGLFEISTWESIARVGISVLGLYLVTIIFSRLIGLRSFAKFTTYDFAVTVAIGSVLASGIIFKDIGFFDTAVAIVLLVTVKLFVAFLSRQFSVIGQLVNNSPLLLVAEGAVIDRNVSKVQMSQEELLSQLRLEKVGDVKDLRVAVLESTGKISVIKMNEQFDPAILGSLKEEYQRITANKPGV